MTNGSNNAGPDSTRAEVLEKSERHATNIELFLDLVFVFAVAQIVVMLAGDLTFSGFGRALLMGWLMWWLWSQFAWLGTTVDLGRRSASQLLVLVAVPITLLMAIALPDSFGVSGMQFAGAYLAVNIFCLLIMRNGVWDDPVTRAAWLAYIPLATLAPVLLLLGAAFEGGTRVIIWVTVALIFIGSAIAAGRGNAEGASAWKVDASHFAERHALFVIIGLGEVMVAIGVAAASAATGLQLSTAISVFATASVACALWWTYFAFVPQAVENSLRASPYYERGRTARDLLTFGHFPVVFGVILYALVAKHVVADPGHSLGAPDLAVLVTSMVLFMGGLIGLRWRAAHGIGYERPTAIVVIVALCALAGPRVPGVVIVPLVAVVLFVTQSLLLRNLRLRARKQQPSA